MIKDIVDKLELISKNSFTYVKNIIKVILIALRDNTDLEFKNDRSYKKLLKPHEYIQIKTLADSYLSQRMITDVLIFTEVN